MDRAMEASGKNAHPPPGFGEESSNNRGRPAWMTRDISLLLVGRALRSAIQSYLAIVVPLYLSMLGFNAVALGILFSISAGASALLVVASGLLSDRLGRRHVMIALSLLMVGGALVFACSRNFALLAAASALGAIGRGGGVGGGGAWGPYYPAEQALIAEHADDVRRTTIFAVLSFAGVIAGAVGSLFALMPAALERYAAMSRLDSYRLLFVFAGAAALATTGVLIPLREKRSGAPAQEPFAAAAPACTPAADPGPARTFGMSAASWRMVWRFMLVNATNGLAIGMLGPFLVYWFYRRYGVGAGELGKLFFVINLAVAFPYLTAGRIALRLGSVGAVVITRAISAVLLAAMALMPSFWMAAALYALRTLANVLSIPVRQSYFMGVIDPAERSTAAGIANLPTQAGSSVGPYLAGYMMEHLMLALPLELASLLMGLNTLLYHLFFREIRPPEELAERRAG